METAQKLEIKASLKIQKPIHEVFEGIVDPEKMKNYFIVKSSGRIEEGKTLTWEFSEVDMQFPVRVRKVESDKFISFEWDDLDGTATTVEMTFTNKQDGTLVTVIEKSRDNDQAGIDWLKRNTEGWANFLACLKAYLEYGINLRKGAFDISQMPELQS
ncbi:MAG TPA: SRPBCC domain-containing protein [Chitinophagaceae bacterium]|nr:SRPBCC domain-containing protein [Chitinophagaceae bacterium]